jgi:hypothetical protein
MIILCGNLFKNNPALIIGRIVYLYDIHFAQRSKKDIGIKTIVKSVTFVTFFELVG